VSKGRSVTRTTWTVAVAGTVAIAAIYSLLVAGIGGGLGASVATNVGGVGFQVLAVCMILRAALGHGRGEALRRQWLLIGAGMTAYAFGGAVFSYSEVILRQDVAVPGPADAAYVVQYALMSAGLVLVALSYRRLVSLERRVLAAVGIAAALAIPVYALLLAHIAADTTLSVGERALRLFYPLGDLFLLLAPALTIIFVMLHLGKGRLAWPWAFLATGIFLYAFADTTFSVFDAQGLYQPGQPIDIAWMVGSLCVAVGASLAWDIAHGVRSRAVYAVE
jgi:hypothetical protein